MFQHYKLNNDSLDLGRNIRTEIDTEISVEVSRSRINETFTRIQSRLYRLIDGKITYSCHPSLNKFKQFTILITFC